jgi:hypothetical protein
MAIYYFHLRDGSDVLLDPEGRELADMEAIIEAALHEARGILAADLQIGRLKLDQMIDVEDKVGEVVHRLRFADAVTIRWPEPH